MDVDILKSPPGRGCKIWKEKLKLLNAIYSQWLNALHNAARQIEIMLLIIYSNAIS
jgi:hypothetical protein